MSKLRTTLRQVEPQDDAEETSASRLRSVWEKLPTGGRQIDLRSEFSKLKTFDECVALPAFSTKFSTPWCKAIARNIHDASEGGLAHPVNWDHVVDHVAGKMHGFVPKTGLGRLYFVAAALVVVFVFAASVASAQEDKTSSSSTVSEKFAVRNSFGGRVGTVERLPDGRYAVRNSFGGRVGTVDGPKASKK